MSNLTLSAVVQQAQKAVPVAPARDVRVEKYTEACGRLIADIKTWLKPEVEAGNVRIDDQERPKRISEQGFTYEVPTLRFWVGGRVVDVEPRGIWVIGAHGRADLASQPGAPVILTLNKDLLWEVPKVGTRKITYQPLDSSTFPETLARALALP